MFRDAFRLIADFVGEIETAIGRQLAEYAELALARVERRADVFCGKLLVSMPGSEKRLPRERVEALVRQFARIFAIQPGAFVEIERRVFAIDFFQLEQPDDFIDLDFFAVVLRRPAEEAEIIAHRLRAGNLLRCRC